MPNREPRLVDIRLCEKVIRGTDGHLSAHGIRDVLTLPDFPEPIAENVLVRVDFPGPRNVHLGIRFRMKESPPDRGHKCLILVSAENDERYLAGVVGRFDPEFNCDWFFLHPGTLVVEVEHREVVLGTREFPISRPPED